MPSDQKSRKRKRGNQSTSDATIFHVEDEDQNISGKRRRSSTSRNLNRSNSSPSHRTKSQAQKSRSPAGKSRNQNRSGGSQRSGQPKRSEEAHHYHLSAISRGVPRNVIEKRWEPLPSTAVDRISQILGNVERTVVMRLQDERKRTQASSAVQMVVRKLHRKIIRGLPFPPGTRHQREEDFDFEKILDSNRELEVLLTPTLHSIDLLKAEIKKEQMLLDMENAAFEQLKGNVNSAKAGRREAARKVHPMLRQDNSQLSTIDPVIQDLNLAPSKNQLLWADIAGKDPELSAIFDDLYSHVETMQGNIGQVAGIVEAVEESRTAIEDVILNHMDLDKYDQIVMG